MTPRPAPAPVSDTAAAVTRMAAIARESGLMHTVIPMWGLCACDDGTHPLWPTRIECADEEDARTHQALLRARGHDLHLITWSVWEGYSPARIADAADREARA